MNAAFSPDYVYRYALWRTLQRRLPPWRSETGDTMLFVMLNPSTADDVEDDPTIRRCLGFVRREGFARLAVANVFALRATDPRELAAHPDPVGPLNDEWIARLAQDADRIVLAWGAHPAARERVATVRRLLAGYNLRCLGRNRDGSPCHPLYRPSVQPLEPYEFARAAA